MTSRAYCAESGEAKAEVVEAARDGAKGREGVLGHRGGKDKAEGKHKAEKDPHHDAAEEEAPLHLHRYVNFYYYTPLSALESLRTLLLSTWGRALGVCGRVYLDHEGINAQLSVPARHLTRFKATVRAMPIFRNAPIFEGDLVDTRDPGNRPFTTLHVRIRPLVMDGLRGEDAQLDMTQTGTALPPDAWHELIEEKKRRDQWERLSVLQEGASAEKPITIVDCRNYYESEVGRFEGAVRLEIEKHVDSFAELDTLLEGKQDEKILIYCTGGIRCEKIAAYLTQRRGFKDVNRLHGGINNYAQYVKHHNVPSTFKGKNFVFDQRLDANAEATRVTGDVLAACHLCGVAEDDLVNCANPACNMLFVACPECVAKHARCCSAACEEMLARPKEEVHARLAEMRQQRANFKRTPYTLRPRAASPPTASSASSIQSPTTTPTQQKHSIHTASRPIVSEEAEQFCETWSSPLSEATQTLRAESVREVGEARAQNMLTPHQAQVLKMLVSVVRAERVLEIGTFTGYSAAAMAEALPVSGKLITCEKDSALCALASRLLAHTPHHARIEVRHGDAADTLLLLAKERLMKEMIGDKRGGQFDVVFLDADKLKYAAYADLLLQHGLVRPGGLIIADNVLWRGLVLDEAEAEADKRARAMRAFLAQLRDDARLTMVTLPIGDGFVVAQVK